MRDEEIARTAFGGRELGPSESSGALTQPGRKGRRDIEPGSTRECAIPRHTQSLRQRVRAMASAELTD